MTTCQTLLEQLVDLAQGALPAGAATDLRAHAASCAPCARLLARETALVEALSSLPPTPDVVIPVPPLPMAPVLAMPTARRRSRLASARLAAAVALASAAALLVAIQVSGGFGGAADDDLHEIAVKKPVPVEIHTVLQTSTTLPQADDHFLALTAGVEAVVMRRPAQDRCANGLCASGR